MECRASGDKKSFAGDECSFLRRLLPPRALHEPLQRLRRQLTDQCLPDALEPVDVSRIIEVASAAEPDLTQLLERIVVQM